MQYPLSCCQTRYYVACLSCEMTAAMSLVLKMPAYQFVGSLHAYRAAVSMAILDAGITPFMSKAKELTSVDEPLVPLVQSTISAISPQTAVSACLLQRTNTLG